MNTGTRELKPFELGPFSLRFAPRTAGLVALAAVGLTVLAGFVMTLGSYEIPVAQVARGIVGAGESRTEFVVVELRLPRVLAAILVGAALAGAGALLQGIVRNPLVAPDIVGIHAGATFAAVFWFTTRLNPSLIPVVAFGGATAAAGLIYLLSWRGRIAPSRLVLVGIGMNALLTAGTTLLTVRGRTPDVARAYQWMAGSLYSTGWDDVRVLSVTLLILLPVATSLLHSLRVLQLGDLTAKSVGIRVEVVRLLILLVSCGLSAAAVAATGPIGFVALMVPHIARMIAGRLTVGVFIFACFLGGILLLGSDAIAAHALPVTLPAGVVTSALGAPYFLYLLRRRGVRS